MYISSKIPQYNINNICQNDPHFMFYPTVWKLIEKNNLINDYSSVVILNNFQKIKSRLITLNCWIALRNLKASEKKAPNTHTQKKQTQEQDLWYRKLFLNAKKGYFKNSCQ